jgi:hypothetical protein
VRAMNNRNKPVSVLFIILPYLMQEKEAKTAKTRSFLAFPYGVLSIASYIKANATVSPSVNILDLNLYHLEEVPQIVSHFLDKCNPDVVGISMMFDMSYKHVKGIARQ